MFSKEIEPDRGIILVNRAESRLDSAIHMLFMRYDLTVLWLSRDQVIVDKVLARKWHPIYLPKKPAQYVLEIHPDEYANFAIGEQLELPDLSE